MDSDGFPVLQDGVPSGHLHGDSVDAFPGERARHAPFQGDYRLQREREETGRERESGKGRGRERERGREGEGRERERERAGERESDRERGRAREGKSERARGFPREALINLVNISHRHYLHYRGVSREAGRQPQT